MRGGRGIAALAVTVLVALSACGTEEGAGVPVTPAASGSNDETVAGGQNPDVVTFLDPCPTSGAPSGRGDGLPEIELPCLGPGEPVQMAGLTGRPLLVNVWASWCPPCREEMPWLQQAADTGKIAVLGVDAEDRAASAGELLSSLDITFPSVFDPANEFARSLGVPTKPTTVFVTKEGEIAYVKAGSFTSYDDLAEQVDMYLGVQLP